MHIESNTHYGLIDPATGQCAAYVMVVEDTPQQELPGFERTMFPLTVGDAIRLQKSGTPYRVSGWKEVAA